MALIIEVRGTTGVMSSRYAGTSGATRDEERGSWRNFRVRLCGLASWPLLVDCSMYPGDE